MRLSARFELPEEGRGGEQAPCEAERDRHGLVAVAGLLRLARRCGEQLTRRAGCDPPGEGDHRFAERRVAQRAREADEGDRALDDDEHAQERERPSMAEAVRHPQALEGVDQKVTSTIATQRLECVVAGEVSRLGDEVRGAHCSPSGTMTLIASGSIEKCSSLAAGRAPPSSS